MKIPTLQDVLTDKGAEYAPFDRQRVHRIYRDIANICGFDTYLGTYCKVVHILGTNGKGSTGRFITMGLRQNGKNVLHFSSPHLFKFNERYYISRAHYQGDIQDDVLETAHKTLWQLESVREASYFEYATFLALLLAKDFEYLILEAGVGGEYDSTSVIKANVSVFTLIGRDHEEMLGNSVQEIAQTKLRAMSKVAIIAKQNDKTIENLALDIADKKGAVCQLWQDIRTNTAFYHQIESFFEYTRIHALPAFLCDNLYTAMRTLAFCGMKFDFHILGPLALRGRCEMLTPHIVVDVGHNIDGAKAMCAYFKGKSVNLVYNSYFQKDISAILRELLPIIKKVLIISVKNARICPRDRLVKILDDLAICYEDFDIQHIDTNENYLVFGSFSVAETFLQHFKGRLCKIN